MNSGLHLIQVLFDTQLFVFDNLLLLVHGFLDLLAHHLKHSSVGPVIALFPMLRCKISIIYFFVD